MFPQVEIDPALRETVRLAVIGVSGLALDSGESLWSEAFEPLCRELYGKYGETTISFIPGIHLARDLYKAIGIDPTRWRPASEALLRRVIKGKPLYRINSLVDTVNFCSLRCLLPFGLFDLDRIEGARVTLRRGGAGESFAGIRKDEVNVAGRYTMVDSRGPFGSPTADSERTSIRPDTVNALALIYAPASLESGVLGKEADFAATMIKRYGGGSPEARCLGLSG
jgi:DNA/RNA-binding domain of Phe-tRNA-synthetase-like protein